MEKIKLKDIAEIAIIASIYVSITLLLYPLSYGAVQFRISEALVLLTYFKKKYGIGVFIGVIIANLLNPEFMLLDVVFGGLSTLIAVIIIPHIKRLFVASLVPTITSILVVIELYFVTDMPIYLICLYIFVSMFIIESIIGYNVIRLLLKNNNFRKLMGVNDEVQSQ